MSTSILVKRMQATAQEIGYDCSIDACPIAAAAALIHEGDESFLEGHHAHARLLQQQAEGKPVTIDLLLMHAEDQLMSAEAFKNIALELMSVYQKMAELVQHPQNN